MPVSVKVGGAWKTATAVFNKVGGVWKTAADMPVKIAGVWKTGVLVQSSFESIATFTGNNTVSTYTFSSIPSTYKSLQIRINNVTSGGGGRTGIRFNSDTGSNYNYHAVYGFNDVVGATGLATTAAYVAGYQAGPGPQGPTAIITDIIDYASTSKNKTIKSFYGVEKNLGAGNSEVGLSSGLWRNTAAVTSITVFCGLEFDAGTSIALYGIK